MTSASVLMPRPTGDQGAQAAAQAAQQRRRLRFHRGWGDPLRGHLDGSVRVCTGRPAVQWPAAPPAPTLALRGLVRGRPWCGRRLCRGRCGRRRDRLRACIRRGRLGCARLPLAPPGAAAPRWPVAIALATTTTVTPALVGGLRLAHLLVDRADALRVAFRRARTLGAGQRRQQFLRDRLDRKSVV